MADRRGRLQSARLYLVCGECSDAFLIAAIRGGVDVVQLRMKTQSDEQRLDVARRYARICAAGDVLFILNDRPDLAARTGADGIHVGQDDASVADARELVGTERILGVSTHSPAQIEAALASDVDYIGVGPVHETPTKPGRPAVGLELVRYAAEHATVPFFAIGGISPENVSDVARAGAGRVAVVRALTEARDPERAARALREAVRGEVGVGAA